MANSVEPFNKVEFFQRKNSETEINEEEKTFLKKLKDWSESSTAHGLVKLTKKNHIVGKLYWTICIIASWSCLAYMSTTTIMEYLEFKYTVAVELESERPSRFPAVDICSLSPYSKLKTNFSPNFTHNEGLDKKDLADQYILGMLNKYESTFTKEELKLYGHDIKNIILSCKFQRKKCNISKDFTQYHNFYYGNCFRYNGNDLLQYNEPGSRYGLQLELYTDAHNNTLSTRSGFVILIHNQSNNMFSFPEDNGIMISPGFETNIAYTKKFMENLPWPYNDCMGDFNDTFFNYLVEKSRIMKQMKNELNEQKYDQNKCIKMCFQNYIINKCSCYLYDLPNLNFGKINGCLSQYQYCSNNAEIEFFNSESDIECYKQCPNSCNQLIYDTKISFSKYPSDWFLTNFYGNYQNKSLNEIKNQIEKHISVVNVYSDMVYTHIYQSPYYTPISLLATLGGNIGLFAGWSILTIMESIDLMVYMLF